MHTIVNGIDTLTAGLTDAGDLLEMAVADGDEDTVNSVISDLAKLEAQVGKLEFQRMFSGKMDATNAFVDIQAGAGGTEAQDWAEMLLRRYPTTRSQMAASDSRPVVAGALESL